jgi:hypothetical protein
MQSHETQVSKEQQNHTKPVKIRSRVSTSDRKKQIQGLGSKLRNGFNVINHRGEISLVAIGMYEQHKFTEITNQVRNR